MRDKGYSNSQFYRSANNVSHNTVGGDVERHRIWLDLVTPSQTIRTLVAYVEGQLKRKTECLMQLLIINLLKIFIL